MLCPLGGVCRAWGVGLMHYFWVGTLDSNKARTQDEGKDLMALTVLAGRAVGSSFQAGPPPGGNGLLLEWAVESLKPRSVLEEGLLAGVKNHQLSAKKT